MVDSNGGPTDKLVDQGGYGGLDWTERRLGLDGLRSTRRSTGVCEVVEAQPLLCECGRGVAQLVFDWAPVRCDAQARPAPG